MPLHQAPIARAVAVAKAVRPAPFPAYPSECLTLLEPAEQALWPENDDRKVQSKHDQSLVRGVEQEPTERLDNSDRYAGEKAAEDAAEPAERHGNECQQSKIRAPSGKM